MENRQRIRRGMGKIEFVAISEEAHKLFAAGYNLRIAYDELVEKGRLSMSYSSFCGYAKTMYASLATSQTTQKIEDTQNMKKDHSFTNHITGQNMGRLGQSAPPSFKHDPNPDPEKVFGPGWNITKP